MRSPVLTYSLFAVAAAAPALVAAAPSSGPAPDLAAGGASVHHVARQDLSGTFHTIVNALGSGTSSGNGGKGNGNGGNGNGNLVETVTDTLGLSGDNHNGHDGDKQGKSKGGKNAASPQLGGLGRRADDAHTAGGNAYSGATTSASGGNVVAGSDHARGQFAQFAESDLNH